MFTNAPPTPAAASAVVPWRPHCRRNLPVLSKTDDALIAVAVGDEHVAVHRVHGDLGRRIERDWARVQETGFRVPSSESTLPFTPICSNSLPSREYFWMKPSPLPAIQIFPCASKEHPCSASAIT